MKTLKEIQEALKAKRDEAKAVYDTLLKEGPEEGKRRPATDEELKTLTALNEECAALERERAELLTVSGAKDMISRVDQMAATPVQAVPGLSKGSTNRRKTLFDSFMDNEKFAEWQEKCAKGTVDMLPKLSCDGIGIKSTLVRLGGSESAGELVMPQQTGIVDNPWLAGLRIRDLVTVATTTSSSVEYVRVTDFDNQAAEIAEANSVQGDSGRKPRSGVVFERVNEPVKGIAHLFDTTEWALQDAGNLAALLNQLGIYGVERKLDRQMIRGAGGAVDFEGILNTDDIQTPAFSNDILETALKAQTAVTLEFDDDDSGGAAEPTAYAMHPLDWQEFLLFRDDENRFYWGGPAVVGPRTLWGLPVVTTAAVPRGRPIVADWRFAWLWDRQQATVETFRQNRDNAERNMVTIRAELRAAFGVIRPQAFVEFPMSAGSGS